MTTGICECDTHCVMAEAADMYGYYCQGFPTVVTTRMLSPEEILEKGEFIQERLEEAFDKGQRERSMTDYADAIIKGDAQVWLVEDGDIIVGVCLTKFIEYPNYKALHIVALSGNRWKEWGPESHERLEEFAKETGCEKIEVWGRPGWSKALKDIPEYKEVYRVFAMEVNND